MSSNRRKQQQPRHIIQDPFLLTETLQNAISFDYSTPSEIERSCDNHICGRCCAEFYSMPDFLLHKKHCTNEWPVSLVSDDSPEELSTAMQGQTSTIVNPYNATEIQMALASLQRQQVVQLQMIQQIYSQLLGDKTTEDAVANGNGDVAPVVAAAVAVTETSKNRDKEIVEGEDEKCRLCGKIEPDLERMQNHLRVEHSRELNLPYACNKCSFRFASRDELRDHVIEYHLKKLVDDDEGILDADETYDDDEGVRPKSHPPISRLLAVQFRQDSDAKSDPGTFRCHGSSGCSPTDDSEMWLISSPDDSDYAGINDDSMNNCDYRAPGENGPLDLSRTSLTTTTTVVTSSKPRQFSSESSEITSKVANYAREPQQLYSSMFSTSAFIPPPTRTRSKSPPSPSIMEDGGNNNNNEDDWESLMEIQNTDDTAKIRQMVGDKETKLTDPNQCIVCHRILSCKSALQMHYRTHTGTRPFKCKVCQRAFTTKGNLKTHMGVHRTKPPFRLFHQCPVCHKRFTNGLVLQQHIRLHVGQPPEISMDQINAGELRDSDSRSNSPLPPPPPPPPPPVAAPPPPPPAPSVSILQPTTTSATNGGLSTTTALKYFSAFGSVGSIAAAPFTPVGNGTEKSAPINDNNNEHRRKSVADCEMPQSVGSVHRRAFSFSPATNCPFPASAAAAGVEPASPIGFQQMPPLLGSNPYTAVMGPTPQQMAIMSGRPSTTCNICFKTFACFSALEIHYRSHTKERPFKCDVCNRGFSTKGNMKQHLLTHKIRDGSVTSTSSGVTTKNNGFHGSECHGDRTPTSVSANNNDDRLSVNDDSGRESSHSQSSQSQPMPAIKSEYVVSNLFENGMKNKNGTPPSPAAKFIGSHRTTTIYVPEPGEILPPDDANLDGSAVSTATSNGPTPLESIQKMWAKTETLAAASSSADSAISPAIKRSVSALNKHQCQLCYKNFSSASALQIHMRTHTGDRPFSCKVCGRAFTTKGNLKVHMGTHMWTNANRRGRRIFDSQTTPSRSSLNGADFSDDNDDSCSSLIPSSKEIPPGGVNGTPTLKDDDNDEAAIVKSKAYGRYIENNDSATKTTTTTTTKFHHPHLPSSFSVTNPNNVLLSQHSGASPVLGFPHPDILAQNFLAANHPAFSPTSTFSPYAAAAAAQLGHHFSSVNGRSSSGAPTDGSLEAAMLLMWRTVCSVCHKVCASVDELEDHLKHHLGQVGIDRKTPLQT